MPSPFPGMNPYLEQVDAWHDFHERLIPAIGDALSPQVSPHFIVKIATHLYSHEPEAGQRILIGHGDVNRSHASGSANAHGGTATLSAPAQVLLPVTAFEKQTYLEILDRHSRELVTVIELLSPSNKEPGPDRAQYLVRRGKVLRSTAHFVEIDLLRGWRRMPSENAPASDSCIMVSVAEDRPRAAYWPIVLREPLPVIPIPLRDPVPLAQLDLQAVLHQVHDRAYYKDYIYRGQPVPALNAEDAAWAREVVTRATASGA